MEIWERTKLGDPDRARNGGLHARRPGGARHHQPARDHGGAGTRKHRAPVLQRRSSGRTPAPTGIASALEREGQGDVDPAARPACRPRRTSPAGKIQWILENVDGVREAAERGDALFGNTDTWVLWNLTGGTDGGVHVTDVTNASRTMLMDLETLDWDDELLALLRHPPPDAARDPPVLRTPSRTARRASTRPAGAARCPIDRRSWATSRRRPSARSASPPARPRTPTAPATSCCSTPAPSWCRSSSGLLTTVCYKFGDATCRSTRWRAPSRSRGPAVQWLRDQLRHHQRCGARARPSPSTVEDNGGVYFVPAFSGLFAPYWRSDARGAIVGLAALQHQRAPGAGHAGGHLLPEPRRASRPWKQDSGVHLDVLKVDGGVTANDLCMRDPGRRPRRRGESAGGRGDHRLGAARPTRPGWRSGFWRDTDELRAQLEHEESRRWEPAVDGREARHGVRGLEEGGGADARLGRRVLTRVAPATASALRIPIRRAEIVAGVCQSAATPASATLTSWSTLPALTLIAPITTRCRSAECRRRRSPGRRWSARGRRAPRPAVRAVRGRRWAHSSELDAASLIEMSILALMAPSMRAKATRCPPSSTTAMLLIGWPWISPASTAASTTLVALVRLMALIETFRIGFPATNFDVHGGVLPRVDYI